MEDSRLEDASNRAILFDVEGVSIDLGGAGKGYAVDRAIGILREHGVTSALLHGGTSSVHAIGAPPGEEAWRIGWRPADGTFHTFALRDRALSASAIEGRTFAYAGGRHGHVMDPRTGAPSSRTRAAVVSGPRSLECDALATALLVLGAGWAQRLRATFPGYTGIAE